MTLSVLRSAVILQGVGSKGGLSEQLFALLVGSQAGIKDAARALLKKPKQLCDTQGLNTNYIVAEHKLLPSSQCSAQYAGHPACTTSPWNLPAF